MKTTINMMVRNEPFSALGLLSIINYTDNVLIYDTGSTDNTYENLLKVKELFPDKITLKQVDLPDGQTWSYRDGEGVSNLSEQASVTLGKLRRDMHEECDGDIIWLLDGDEVYYDELAKAVPSLVADNLKGKVCVFMPFVDLRFDGLNVRLNHDMGRLFNKAGTYINGEFGFETHYDKIRNKNINNWDECSLVIRPGPHHMPCVLHFESPVKPWRKNQTNLGAFKFKLPEVFYQEEYKQFIPFDKYEWLKEYYN